MDVDGLFVEVMSNTQSLGNAIQELLAFEVDGRRVFEPHLGVEDVDHSVECMLLVMSKSGGSHPLPTGFFFGQRIVPDNRNRRWKHGEKGQRHRERGRCGSEHRDQDTRPALLKGR